MLLHLTTIWTSYRTLNDPLNCCAISQKLTASCPSSVPMLFRYSYVTLTDILTTPSTAIERYRLLLSGESGDQILKEYTSSLLLSSRGTVGHKIVPRAAFFNSPLRQETCAR